MINSRNTLFINIISALFIFLFTYTAISKLLKMELFKYVLSKSPLVGNWAGLAAWSIVITEWVIVLLLLYPPIRIYGLLLTVALMTLFTGYILVMLLTASHLPCSCGGILKELGWRQHFYLNAFLTLLSVSGLILERNRRSLLKKRSL